MLSEITIQPGTRVPEGGFKPAPGRKVQADPEYINLVARYQNVVDLAKCLVGTPACDPRTDPTLNSRSQADIATQIDDASRLITDFGGRDFRGPHWKDFSVKDNGYFKPVRDAFDPSMLVPTEVAIGNLQSMLDEMNFWWTDLHKNYDFKTPSAPDPIPPPPSNPPFVNGILTVAPTDITVTPGGPQRIRLLSGGTAQHFTATPTSDANWLLVGAAGSPTPPNSSPLVADTPDRGALDLIVAVGTAPTGDGPHYGRIIIVGTPERNNTTIVNVTYKATPAKGPSPDDLADLAVVDQDFDQAKALMSLLGDNLKTLESAQGTLRTAYVTLVKVEDDFARREQLRIVTDDGTGILHQNFDLGTDRKVTSAGYISCVSDIDGKTLTTTNINYSLLYQNVPHWSASAGFLTSFLDKQTIGLTDANTSTTLSQPNDTQSFQITDHAPVQFVPMAFANYRVGRRSSTWFGKGREDELIWTAGLSAGFGINPNTGTNQPEFFAGLALGLNRLIIHPGVHFGRTESIGGGYSLNVPFPAGTAPSTTPLNWSYRAAFSIGFSVRVAPY